MASNSETHGPQGLANKTYIRWIPVAMINQGSVVASLNGDHGSHRSIWRPFENGQTEQNLDVHQKLDATREENFKSEDKGREQACLDQTIDIPWNRHTDQSPRILCYWSEAQEIPNPPPPSPQTFEHKGTRRVDSNSRSMIFQPIQKEVAIIQLPIDNQFQVFNQDWTSAMMKEENQNDGLLPCNQQNPKPKEENIPSKAIKLMSLNTPTSANHQLGTGERNDLREKLTWSRQANNWNRNNKKKQRRRQFLRQKKAKHPQNKWKKNEQPSTHKVNHIFGDPNEGLNALRDYTTRNKQNYLFELLAPSISMLKKPTFNPFAQPHYEDDMLTGQSNCPNSPLTQQLVTEMQALQIDPKETKKIHNNVAPTNSQMTGLHSHCPKETQNPTKPKYPEKNAQTNDNINNTHDKENMKPKPQNKDPVKETEKDKTPLNEQPRTTEETETQTNHMEPNELHKEHNPNAPIDKPPKTIHPHEVRKRFTTADKETPEKIEMLINRYQILFDTVNCMTTLAQSNKDKPFFPQIQEMISDNQNSMAEVLDEIEDLFKKSPRLEEDNYITVPKFGEEDKIDMKVIDTLPTFDPKDIFITLHQFWQKISQYVETFGLTEKATKMILQFRLQGEAYEVFEMNQERPIREIVLSLRDNFGGFPTKTDFEEQMNVFRRGKMETIKSAMNRYEYIINQIYHDAQDLAQIKEIKCKEMVKKIAMAEALEHLLRTEDTSKGVDISYQDCLKFLSREEDIIKKRYHPAINSLERCHPLQFDEESISEDDYEFNPDGYNTNDEEDHAEENSGKTIYTMTKNTNDYPTEEAPLNPDDECLECFNDETMPPEPSYNDLLQENESLKEEMAAMREDLVQGNLYVDYVDQDPENPSINLLVDEYDKLRRLRELQEQQPPRLIRIEDQHYERKSTEYDQPEFDTEYYYEEDPEDEDEEDYDIDDYLDQPVPNEAVIQILAAENAQLRREIYLRETIQQMSNVN